MAFAYKRSLTIDHNKVPNTNQSNFAVPVILTNASLKSVGNGGHVSNSNGYDVWFYSDSALTSRLAAERVSYNASTGAIVCWVKVPTVATAADTVFYMAYGDGSISSDPNSDATYGSTSAWDSSFKGVWHFEDGATFNANDSVASGHNGTVTGVVAASGQVGGGGSYTHGTGSSDAVTVAGAAVNLDVGMVDMWFKPNFLMGTSNSFWLDVDNVRYAFWADGTGSVSMYCDGLQALFGGVSWSINTWHHIAFAYNKTGNVQICYFDGAAKTASSVSGTWGSNSVGTNAYIGARISVFTDTTFTGVLDEIRTHSAVRSADWIATYFNATSSPSTFLALGSEIASFQAAWALGSNRILGNGIFA